MIVVTSVYNVYNVWCFHLYQKKKKLKEIKIKKSLFLIIWFFIWRTYYDQLHSKLIILSLQKSDKIFEQWTLISKHYALHNIRQTTDQSPTIVGIFEYIISVKCRCAGGVLSIWIFDRLLLLFNCNFVHLLWLKRFHDALLFTLDPITMLNSYSTFISRKQTMQLQWCWTKRSCIIFLYKNPFKEIVKRRTLHRLLESRSNWVFTRTYRRE